ncbi:MAG: dihydroorotase [Verrucomicrobiae bacterium]|nr:dihydroorotase [Verrucomicrobiae bacterium]
MILRGGRVIDPARKIDQAGDVWIGEGRFVKAGSFPEPEAEIIELAGKIVAPGLIDIHVHLREPGQTAKETIHSGTEAAARGGFTSVVCMPNTSPPVDDAGTVELIKARAREEAVVRVYPTGAITVGLAGEEMTSMGSLKRAGVVALTDDGKCVQNNELMRRAVEYARMFELPIMDHCQDYKLAGDGVMHEGVWSMKLGLSGWPAIAEEMIVARNCLLAEMTGWKIHCQHLSSAGSVRLIRDAKKRGVPISGELCPHHVALTDAAVQNFDTNFKMNPPLRSEADVEALIEGVADGTIDIFASDHAPHCEYEKEVEFDYAPFGILGLETQLGLFLTEVVHKRKAIDLPGLVARYTSNPARLLNLPCGTMEIGSDADVTVIDPDKEWTVRKEDMASLSRNTPFDRWELKGKAVLTIVGGEVVHDEL